MSGIVREDDEQAGIAEISALSLYVKGDSRLEIWPPDSYASGGAEYVLDLGRTYVHMHRAELERLHALIGRALDENESEES